MTDRRIALVTGGASGIGAAVCHLLATQGVTVAILDLNGGGAESVASDLAGDDHLGLAGDVSDAAAVRQAIDTTVDSLGPITILVNVAGWDQFMPFVDTTPDFWQRVIDINYVGVLNTCHALLPDMIERGYGRIVNVASDAARVGSSLEAVYAGSKGAVVAFSKSVAREVARSGVTVNVVCPGPTDTPLIRDAAAQMASGDRFIAALEKAVPMRRLAQPDDIAPAVGFFVSEAARFVTGQTLSVSGGLTMA